MLTAYKIPPSILLSPLQPASSIHPSTLSTTLLFTHYLPTQQSCLAPVSLINTRTKSNLEKGFVWLIDYYPLSREAKARAQGRNLETRTEAKTMEEYRLLLCSPWFIQSRTIYLGVAPHTLDRALPHQSRKVPKTCPRANLRRVFSQWRVPLPN